MPNQLTLRAQARAHRAMYRLRKRLQVCCGCGRRDARRGKVLCMQCVLKRARREKERRTQ